MIDEKKLEKCAKIFFLDCRNGREYPFKTWQEQQDEMRNSVTPEFVDFVCNANENRDVDAEIQQLRDRETLK